MRERLLFLVQFLSHGSVDGVIEGLCRHPCRLVSVPECGPAPIGLHP